MNNLKQVRKAKGYTQVQIAKAIGVNQNTYSYWENGKTKIDNETLVKLAKLLDTSVDYLLGNEPQPQEPAPIETPKTPLNPEIAEIMELAKQITQLPPDQRKLIEAQIKAWAAMDSQK